MLKIKSCLVDNNARLKKYEVDSVDGIVEFVQRPMTQGENVIASDESRITETKTIPDEKNPKNSHTEFFVRTKIERLSMLRVLFSLGGEYKGRSHKIGDEGWTLKDSNDKILPVNLDNLDKLHPQVFAQLSNNAIELNSFDEAEVKN